MTDSTPATAATKPIKCGQCQQAMTVDEFFSDDHPCLVSRETVTVPLDHEAR